MTLASSLTASRNRLQHFANVACSQASIPALAVVGMSKSPIFVGMRILFWFGKVESACQDAHADSIFHIIAHSHVFLLPQQY
jgi:hypothetical protein